MMNLVFIIEYLPRYGYWSTTANAQADTLTIAGGTNITTTVAGDTLTVDFSGTLTTTLSALTDTDLSGAVQGDSLFFNGTNWIATRSPLHGGN